MDEKEANIYNNRKKFWLFIGAKLVDIIKLYASTNRANRFDEILEMSTEVFNVVETIFNNNADFQEILGGEFNVINYENISLPLFVILDMIHLYCNQCRDAKVILSCEDNKRFEDIIERARKLEFSPKFKSHWHVNPKFADETHGEILCRMDNLNIYKDKYKTNSEILFDEFKSLANMGAITPDFDFFEKDWDFILKSDVMDDPEFDLGNPFVLTIKRTSYFYKTINVSNEAWYKLFFFEEQEKEVKNKYHEFVEYLEQKKQAHQEKRYALWKKRFQKSIIPYVKSENFKDFVLVDSLPWDENPNLKKMVNCFEKLYSVLSRYREQTGMFSLEELLDDRDFFKCTDFYTRDIEGKEGIVKEQLVNDLISIYFSTPKILKKLSNTDNFDKEVLEKNLLRLSLIDLYNCTKAFETQLFGYMQLARVIKN